MLLFVVPLAAFCCGASSPRDSMSFPLKNAECRLSRLRPKPAQFWERAEELSVRSGGLSRVNLNSPKQKFLMGGSQ